jgi:hypothetical protein
MRHQPTCSTWSFVSAAYDWRGHAPTTSTAGASRILMPRAWHLPQFTNVTAGLPAAVEYERQAVEGQRLYGLGTSLVINLLLCLAGVSSLAVFIA